MMRLRSILLCALATGCQARLLQPSPLLSLRGGEAKSSDLLAQLSAVKPSLPKLDLSKCVDSILAGIGLAGSCALSGVLAPRLGKKLFVPPMMASGIIFFSPQAPPSPKGLISGTIGSGSVSAAMLALLKKVDASQTACFGAAAGALLVWYKATGCIFPPAAVVCVLMAGTPWGPTQGDALSFLLTPWLAGHACLYAGAMGTAALRGEARRVINKSRLKRLGAMSKDELKAIFLQFDTSKDGCLDATELKVALRVAIGVDLALKDCVKLVAEMDVDGNGTVDFSEFLSICQDKTE
jgi:hypothetical protein